jgi:NRDE-2, necessary for RNA interference
MSFNTQLADLEEFWDSECPRLGEEGAEGWASWYSAKKDAPPLSSEALLLPNIPDLDPYRQWASEELQADLKLCLPTRAVLDAQDPYSTVLLADIRPMLLNIESQRARHGFRMAWLSFLGLHIPGFSLSSDDNSDWDDRWNAGYLTGPYYLHSLFPSETTQRHPLSDSVAGAIVGRERAYSTPFGPVRYWGHDVSRPLDLSSGEPGRLPRRALWTSDDIADVDANIVRRLFTSLSFSKGDPEWDVLALAFEMAFNPKRYIPFLRSSFIFVTYLVQSALKLSKAFLSVHRDSLGHWNAHAQVERLRGRLDEARKIYQTILIVSRMGNIRPGESQMWWNWAEMEWLDGRDEQALKVIFSSVGMEASATGVAILRTKRSLEAMITSAEFSPQWKGCEAWIKLRALLELLTSQDPTAALAILDESLEKGSCASESFMTAALILLYFHSVILKRPTPPFILRERAGTAVKVYPSNSIILGIFLEAEKGHGLWGRVRTTLGTNAGGIKDVARRAEEVWMAGWQEGRWQSEVERTRSGLATAVEHERYDITGLR